MAGLVPDPTRGPSPEVKPWPGAAIVLLSDGRTTYVDLPALTHATVAEHTDSVVAGSGAAQQVCAWLWGTVIASLLTDTDDTLTGATQWVFVPTGHVGVLPLHAAGSTTTGWIDDRALVRVSPSLLSLTNDTHTPAATGAPVVAISEAVDLAFLPADQAIATGLLEGASIVPEPVTPDTVLTALVEAPAAVISGHAVHSLAEGGGLALGQTRDDTVDPATDPAGGMRPRWLSAEAVERLPLRARGEAFLSACSSGQIATDLPDEAIGLPSAFRHAGFRSVIAATWPV